MGYNFPESLIALEGTGNPRVMFVESPPSFSSPSVWNIPPLELDLSQACAMATEGDLVVLNDTRVKPCRIFTSDEVEILFVRQDTPNVWEVLFPLRGMALGSEFQLPGGRVATLVSKGLPQKIEIRGGSLSTDYFDQYGELALPPYIQRMRGERHCRALDRQRYQSDWSRVEGSVAAPTASLHFDRTHIDDWMKRGVEVAWTTLHVGLGTFLPIKAENLADHKMHKEWCRIPKKTLQLIAQTRSRGGRVFALGTTVARTLESWAQHLLKEEDEEWVGETDLFIRPGFEFRVVDVLMTNFHQPESTLLAMVCAFAGQERVLSSYQWAVERGFRLFSYGDLTIWEKCPVPLKS
ncbi:MAG: tRNA preQ1(34) S-adenosylmethionine ribosyltransferase-isomerase QueA [Bdellovibrionales bacterium]|nr:tRNA preQ1(34) S-adenosylmethionine ribosyltransferase-isomerase QueA [Bdellovibrionales bacterium]